MVYLILGAGFEEAEAIVPCDLLRRAGVEVRLAGIGGTDIPGSHGIPVHADCAAEAAELTKADMLILPGGLGCLAGVILFGVWKGFWYNYIGICAGSMAAFAIARACGRPLLESVFPAKMIEKYDRWMGSRFAKWFAFLIFIPVAPDDYLCFLAGTTRIGWRLYAAIILLCKPASIALYSLGLTVVAQNLLGLWR